MDLGYCCHRRRVAGICCVVALEQASSFEVDNRREEDTMIQQCRNKSTLEFLHYIVTKSKV